MEENISNENDEIEKVTRMQSFEVSLPETNPPPKKFPLKTILIVSGLIALSINNNFNYYFCNKRQFRLK